MQVNSYISHTEIWPKAARRDDIIIDDLTFRERVASQLYDYQVASLWASADLVEFSESLPIFYPKLHIGVSEDV